MMSSMIIAKRHTAMKQDTLYALTPRKLPFVIRVYGCHCSCSSKWSSKNSSGT